MQTDITGDFIKIPNPPGNSIAGSYSLAAYPTIILIAPNRNIVNQDIWPISNTILRNVVTGAGGIPSSCDPIEPESIDAEMLSITVPETNYIGEQQITPSVTIRNAGAENITSADVSYTLNESDPISVNWSGNIATGETAIISFDPINIVAGNYVFVATVIVADDVNPDNNSLSRNFSVADCSDSPAIPYNETFNSADLPLCWSVQNQHPTHTWVSTTGYTIGEINITPQTGSHFWYVNWSDSQNQDEWLISPSFDFSNLINPQISFWFNGNYHWAVAPENNCDLLLMLSVDGGEWTEVWNETDHPDFSSTAVSYTWIETVLNLGDYAGAADFKFAFRYTGYDGAQFAVDNVLITDVTTSICRKNLSNNISIFPNPAETHIIIGLNEGIEQMTNFSIYNQLGQELISGRINSEYTEVSVKELAEGLYFLNITNSDGMIISNQKFIKK